MKLTRRSFAALAAAPVAFAQQPAANPEQRRGTPPEVPPFRTSLEFSRSDVRAESPAVRDDAGSAAGWSVQGRAGVESRIHVAAAGGPAGAQFPRECRDCRRMRSHSADGSSPTTASDCIVKANCAAISPGIFFPPARCCMRRRATRLLKQKAMRLSINLRSASENFRGGYLSAFPTRIFRPARRARERVGAVLYGP